MVFLGVIFIGIVVYAILRKVLSEVPSMQRTQELKRVERELENYRESEKTMAEARERAKELEKSLKKRRL